MILVYIYGVVNNVLACDIVVSEFEIQLRYSNYSWISILRKDNICVCVCVCVCASVNVTVATWRKFVSILWWSMFDYSWFESSEWSRGLFFCHTWHRICKRLILSSYLPSDFQEAYSFDIPSIGLAKGLFFCHTCHLTSKKIILLSYLPSDIQEAYSFDILAIRIARIYSACKVTRARTGTLYESRWPSTVKKWKSPHTHTYTYTHILYKCHLYTYKQSWNGDFEIEGQNNIEILA